MCNKCTTILYGFRTQQKITSQFIINIDRGYGSVAAFLNLNVLYELSFSFYPLNGKVERSQKTDLEEFYATANLSNFKNLREELECWQFYYNWERPHGALKGKTPSQINSSLLEKPLCRKKFWLRTTDLKSIHRKLIITQKCGCEN